MREILFRGKRTSDGEWVYGSFVEANRRWHDHGIHKEWIVISAFANGGYFNVMQRCAVDPTTVGQYTGLTDKNGKKIFEGDILCNERGICYGGCYSAVVKYNNGEFMAEGFVNFYAVDFCVLEVIGNINDNPELLEDTT